MPRTWPSPAIRLIRCGALVLVYIWVAGMALRGWVEDAGTVVSVIVQGLVAAGGALVLQAGWRETLVLTKDRIIVGNASLRREVPLAKVAQATACPDGVYVRLRDGDVVYAALSSRLAVNPWRRRRREEAARLINEAVTRHELLRRLAVGMVAVQRVRSGP